MSTPQDTCNEPQPPQFGIKHMLWAMTGVAALCGVCWGGASALEFSVCLLIAGWGLYKLLSGLNARDTCDQDEFPIREPSRPILRGRSSAAVNSNGIASVMNLTGSCGKSANGAGKRVKNGDDCTDEPHECLTK
jgi:hypothetical protein